VSADSASGEQRVNLAVEFLRVAEQDFSAAELLLERGLYPQGLFFLQQSLEKAAKAILLALGAEPSELKREVGHDIISGSLRYLIDLFYRRYSDFEKVAGESAQALKKRGDQCAAVVEEWDRFVDEVRQMGEMENRGVLNIAILIAQSRGLRVEVKNLDEAVELIAHQLRDFTNALYADDKYAKMFYLSVFYSLALQMTPPSLLTQFYKNVSLFQYLSRLLSNVANCIGAEPGELIRAQVPLLKTIVSAIYLRSAFFLLVVAHIPFEGQAAKLRYPDYGWSPLSIGGNSAVVKIAREIVDVVKDLDFFKGLAACIQQSDECPVFKLVFSPTPST